MFPCYFLSQTNLSWPPCRRSKCPEDSLQRQRPSLKCYSPGISGHSLTFSLLLLNLINLRCYLVKLRFATRNYVLRKKGKTSNTMSFFKLAASCINSSMDRARKILPVGCPSFFRTGSPLMILWLRDQTLDRPKRIGQLVDGFTKV